MLIGCIDYEAVANMEALETPTPAPSEDLTVDLAVYEALEDQVDELDEYVDKLLEDQDNANEDKQNLLDENEMKESALQQAELSVYRSVISKGELEYYFAVIKQLELKDNGDLMLVIDRLDLTNEKFDSSYYNRSQIEDINKSLEFEYANRITETIKVSSDTILRYDGISVSSLDDSFALYVGAKIDEAEKNKNAVTADDNKNDQEIFEPVFIFLTLDGNAIMVLEK